MEQIFRLAELFILVFKKSDSNHKCRMLKSKNTANFFGTKLILIANKQNVTNLIIRGKCVDGNEIGNIYLQERYSVFTLAPNYDNYVIISFTIAKAFVRLVSVNSVVLTARFGKLIRLRNLIVSEENEPRSTANPSLRSYSTY